MNELLKINYETEQPTVSARDLHEGLEIKTEFRKWFPRMAEYGFEENCDWKRVSQKCPTPGGEQEMVDYQISIDMAKQICMIQRTEKGRQYRQYFLDLEKAWNTPEQVFARALKMADRTIEQLKKDNSILLKENTEMKPKAEFHDAVTASDDSITFDQMAKVLKSHGINNIGRNRLFADLRASGILMQNNIPYQIYMEKKWFKVKETVYSDKMCRSHIRTQTFITPKGQEEIINAYRDMMQQK